MMIAIFVHAMLDGDRKGRINEFDFYTAFMAFTGYHTMRLWKHWNPLFTLDSYLFKILFCPNQ